MAKVLCHSAKHPSLPRTSALSELDQAAPDWHHQHHDTPPNWIIACSSAHSMGKDLLILKVVAIEVSAGRFSPCVARFSASLEKETQYVRVRAHLPGRDQR